MNTDELKSLADQCEARAKAGEIPKMPWRYMGMIYFLPCIISDMASVVATREGYVVTFWGRSGSHSYPALTTLTAAQLFAESLLLSAVEPLVAAEIAEWRKQAHEANNAHVARHNECIDLSARVAELEAALGRLKAIVERSPGNKSFLEKEIPGIIDAALKGGKP